jgi:hypothetical protein
MRSRTVGLSSTPTSPVLELERVDADRDDRDVGQVAVEVHGGEQVGDLPLVRRELAVADLVGHLAAAEAVDLAHRRGDRVDQHHVVVLGDQVEELPAEGAAVDDVDALGKAYLLRR